eukprot:jgi/Tetstr1/458190/TSEL_044681.t1
MGNALGSSTAAPSNDSHVDEVSSGAARGAATSTPPLSVPTAAAEGMFMPMEELDGMPQFPRRGASACSSRPYSSFDASKTLFIFLSHRWLRPSRDPQQAHPDLPDSGSPKLELVKLACGKLKHSLPPGFGVALWMDWMSLNQDGNPAEELGDRMRSLIGSCDIILTPVYDPSHARWSYPALWTNYYEEYMAPGWIGDRNAYWERPWCRIEATFAAVTPQAGDDAWKRKVRALQGKPLGAMLAAGRRPHVLFGTKEQVERWPLIFLPPMLHEQLDLYSATRVMSNLTSAADADVICMYVEEAKQSQPLLEVGLVELGGGRVKETLPNGNVYEGGWQNDVRHGHGKCTYANGNTYEGEWSRGQKNGHGMYSYADGAVYSGNWKDDKKHGHGTYVFADGRTIRGDWENDERVVRSDMTDDPTADRPHRSAACILM